MGTILVWLFLLCLVVHVSEGIKDQCSDMLESSDLLKTMNPSECVFKHDRLTCTVRLMSEAVPFNVTSVENTDFSSVVRINLNYIFRFRVLGNTDDQVRCLLLTGVSFRRVTTTHGDSRGRGQEKSRSKVSLPSRLFHLAANSALLGADSELDNSIPAGVLTLAPDCTGDGCVRTVGVSLPEAASQLNLALLAFNYSYTGAGFPDRSGQGKSVARNLPSEKLQRLHLRGDIRPEDFPALGDHATDLDLSHTKNLSTWEPQTDGLRHISLSHSGLRSVPSFVRRQSALRGLALDGNSALVRAGGPAALRESLTGLSELQELQLSGVKIDTLSGDTLPPLVSLTLLNMSSCGLRQLSFDALTGFPELQRLDLSANLLVHVPSSLVVPCPRIRHLNMAHNKLVRGPKLVLTLLHELDLSANALQSVDELVSEGRVVTLKITHNIVRSIEGGRFSSWAERVDLSHNLITSVTLQAARRHLEGLVALNIRGNHMDCSSCVILELQKWLNETSVLVSPEPMSFPCGQEEEDEDFLMTRVMDVRLTGCMPPLDYALLIVAPLAALLALGAALLALVCLKRAGWMCAADDAV